MSILNLNDCCTLVKIVKVRVVLSNFSTLSCQYTRTHTHTYTNYVGRHLLPLEFITLPLFLTPAPGDLKLLIYIYIYFFFNWKKIALQCCVGFCHTTM